MQTLTAENIAISFGGREILGGVSMRAEKGKITGMLGRNGCGKSTLLKIIFGTQAAADKIIQIDGKTIQQPYTIKGLLNYAPQFSFFPKGMKIASALRELGVSHEKVGNDFPALEPDSKKTFAELSGGSERLWTILILLYAQSHFTLLDEPFTHIMPLHVEQLKLVMQREKQYKGIIVTDHMYKHVTEIADSLYLIKECKSLVVHTKDDLAFHGYIPFC